MKILKTIKDNNIEINFVDITLRGFETDLYFNKIKGYIHRKMIYSNVKVENPKVGNTKKIKITNDKCYFILIVEENGLRPKKYTVYIKYDLVMKKLSIQTNHIITSAVIQCINNKISEENEKNSFIEEKRERYNLLPKGVKNCIPFEDIEYFENAISENTWYSKQMQRLTTLPFALKSPNVKRWLSKLGIYSISKEQKDLDNLAIYVAFRLTKCLPMPEKDIIIKDLAKYIPKEDEVLYSYYLS